MDAAQVAGEPACGWRRCSTGTGVAESVRAAPLFSGFTDLGQRQIDQPATNSWRSLSCEPETGVPSRSCATAVSPRDGCDLRDMQPFIVMNVGSVIARGAPDEVLSNPKSLPLLEDDDA